MSLQYATTHRSSIQTNVLSTDVKKRYVNILKSVWKKRDQNVFWYNIFQKTRAILMKFGTVSE